MTQKQFHWTALSIALLTGATFARVIQCDFINYDDIDYITDNEIVKRGLTWDGIAWAFGSLHGKTTYWHPVTWISHMLDCQLFGLDPALHHGVNLLFHTVNTVLVLVVFAIATQRIWPSALVALLFGIHPLQVDTVAWVTERKNLLSVLFALLSLIAYIRYATPNGRWRSYTAAMGFFALGLMCKPAIVVLPVMLLLFDYWPLQRVLPLRGDVENSRFPGISFRRALIEKVPFFALALASAVITILAHAGIGMFVPAGFSFSARLQNAFVSYLRYLKNVLYPVDLAVYYPHPNFWPTSLVALSAVIVIFFSAVVVWNYRRRRWLIVGWFWFLGSLIPTIGIIQAGAQAMADRFMYLPLIGLGIIAAWSLEQLCSVVQSPVWPRVSFGLLILLFLPALTIRQIGFWRDSRTLWEHALAVTPPNYIAHNNLSDALLQLNEIGPALSHAQIAAALAPGLPMPWCQIGNIYKAETNWPAAITNYQKAAEVAPGWLDMPLLLGQAYEAIGKDAEAVEQYHRALTIDRDSIVALNNLAWILATSTNSITRDGNRAVELATRAVKLTKSSRPVLMGTLAAALAENGKFEDAVRLSEAAAERARALNDEPLAQRNLQLRDLYVRHRRVYEE